MPAGVYPPGFPLSRERQGGGHDKQLGPAPAQAGGGHDPPTRSSLRRAKAGNRGGNDRGSGNPSEGRSIPSLEELRQLLDLKRELSRMYEQAGTPTGNAPQP